MKHKWNILIVNKFDFPRERSKEFQVESSSLLGAVMVASNIIKKDNAGWIIQRAWWLDPNRDRRE